MCTKQHIMLRTACCMLCAEHAVVHSCLLQAEEKMRGKKKQGSREGSRQGSADMSKHSPSVRCMPFSAVSTSTPRAAVKACAADLLKSVT